MNVKAQLYQACLEQIEQRMAAANEALNAAIAAGNEETKSSAGDKYETGRAMMQMEQDKHRAQLAKATLLKNQLRQIDLEKQFEKVELGALVQTDSSRYFIAVGIGKIAIDGEVYFVISPEAPIAKAMLNKRESDSLQFQNRRQLIEKIF